MIRRLINVGMLVAVAGALTGPATNLPDRSARAEADADTALLANISLASAEFGRRLRERVSIDDGVVFVSDVPELQDIEAFPPNVPWSISCGRYFGLSVTFGSGTSQQGGIIDIELAHASITQPQCRQIVAILGKQLAALLR